MIHFGRLAVVFMLEVAFIISYLMVGDVCVAEKVEIVTPESMATPLPKKSLFEGNSKIDWRTNDSYIQAYKELHRGGWRKRNDQSLPQEQSYNTVIRSSHLADHNYPSITQSSSWKESPFPGNRYAHGSHSHTCHDDGGSMWDQGFYVSPLAELHSLLPKKLSLKLILKIILKLILFKMIVKFIAVICLLLFIPAIKVKHSQSGNDDERMRNLNMVSNLIWESIQNKNSTYDEEEELKDIENIAELTEESSFWSGPEAAVRVLQFCVSTVDRIAGLMLTYLRRQRNEQDELNSFLKDKFYDLIRNFFLKFSSKETKKEDKKVLQQQNKDWKYLNLINNIKPVNGSLY